MPRPWMVRVSLVQEMLEGEDARPPESFSRSMLAALLAMILPRMHRGQSQEQSLPIPCPCQSRTTPQYSSRWRMTCPTRMTGLLGPRVIVQV